MISAIKPHVAAMAASELMKYGVNITKIDLSVLPSFRKWAENVITSIVNVQSRLNIGSEKGEYLLDMVKASGSLFYIDGIADVIVYRWNAEEPKIIPLWGSQYIIQQDLFWLGMYPFLKKKPNANGHYEVADMIFSEENVESLSDKSFFFVSHNNHFGHFIIDCLPGLMCWDVCNRKGSLGQVPLPFNYIRGICEILQSCGFGYISNPAFIQGHYRMRSLVLSEALPANIFTGAYLWKQIGPRFTRLLIDRGLDQGLRLTKTSKRIFLGRTGKYASRIANLGQLSQFLSAQGFVFIDPSTTTSVQLAFSLSSAEIVVSESGSTTLNAIIFSAENTRIVSLCSERLFVSTDRAMLHGGLPYMMAFCDRLEFVLGKPIANSPIQSSDICVYDVDQLKLLLRAWS